MTLQIRGLTAGYGPIPVLDHLDLDVAPGDIVGILGANGSGKSTLLSTISGLMRPRAGSIVLDGKRIDGRPAERIAATGVRLLSQRRRVFPGLSVRHNLLSPQLSVGRPDAAAVRAVSDDWMQRFPALGERADDPAAGLSGGQQQLLSIGRILALPSRVLLLDEPSAGLSSQAAGDVAAVLAQKAEDGVALVLVEQDIRFAYGLATRLLHLRGGRLVETTEQGPALPSSNTN